MLNENGFENSLKKYMGENLSVWDFIVGHLHVLDSSSFYLP